MPIPKTRMGAGPVFDLVSGNPLIVTDIPAAVELVPRNDGSDQAVAVLRRVVGNDVNVEYCEDRKRPRHQVVDHVRAVGITNQRNHPAEKPVDLILKLINKHQTGDIICDPFCGSGSTLVAAKQLKRRYIGIDIEPKYCEIARKRLAQTTEMMF